MKQESHFQKLYHFIHAGCRLFTAKYKMKFLSANVAQPCYETLL